MALSGNIKALFQKKILGVPAPIVVGGAAVIGYLGYRYYKNRAGATNGPQSSAVPVVTNPAPGPGTGGGTPGGPDYGPQLAQLTTALGTLQSNLLGLNGGLQALQAQELGLQGQIQGLQDHNQVPPPPASTQPLSGPITLPVGPVYQTPIPQPVQASPYVQSTNIAPNQSYTNWYDQMFLNQQAAAPVNPLNWGQPAGYSQLAGQRIPIYQPLPQYRGPQNPIASQPYYNVGWPVPSATFGSGASAFQVSGHYVTYPNGQQIWVAG